ncbi:hypothetical protein LTR16_000504 [Cryomyces antarcticus]|uniref:Uncharacterized protein n=1 Tax=Cryomyces antarcticus TaxID=329879 RepID=A0ABR0M1J7_9PEZI|nr:hypothetical protein LTR39_000660 [Cryomyces antarcticus]KAK5020944.1 hypothetical protein LTR60_000175 [Cryomyces antarcticus]KAK5142341.1 hypothetical protein LTR04_002263 [Oleoguttula sp. CCFEE 6159]KAK5257491.1 hypothetical protein LTR16_000504 [Cryomyces antarcticus]
MSQSSCDSSPTISVKGPSVATPPDSDSDSDNELPLLSSEPTTKTLAKPGDGVSKVFLHTSRKRLTVVEKILRILRLCRLGKRVADLSPWHKEKLSEAEYQQLWERIRLDHSLQVYVETKARFDYDPSTTTFTLRMPSNTHEFFLDKVVTNIVLRLHGSTNPVVAEAAKNINPGGSPSIKFPNSETGIPSTNCPDRVFRYGRGKYPRAIFEISYSQKRKDLDYLADTYITGSEGRVQLVVGLNVEYSATSKKATVSTWRPGTERDESGEELAVCKADIKDDIFRTDDGAAIKEGKWTIHVKDLVSPEAWEALRAEASSSGLQDRSATSSSSTAVQDHDGDDDNASIEIPFSDLARFLKEAEEYDRDEENDFVGSQPVTKRKWKDKRKRSVTPGLDEEREADFQHLEQIEAERGSQEDSDWIPASVVVVGSSRRTARRRRVGN